MTALWILLGIILLVVLLGFLPVSITAEYQAAGARVSGCLGPFRFRLYPRKDDAEAEQPPPDETPAEKKSEEKEAPQGGKIGPFRELIDLVLRAQADLRNKLRVQELTMYLTVGGGGDDPAAAGILTGTAWAALGGLIPLLESSFRILQRDIQVGIDFFSEETLLYAKATTKISLGAGIRFAAYYGWQGLKWYRKKQKGGNEHGTSNR